MRSHIVASRRSLHIILSFVTNDVLDGWHLSHALAWCKLQIYHASCLDSYASTITRLRNRRLEGGKKVMFLCRSLVRSQRHIVELRVHGIP